ncbi:Adenylosuccinate synthetase [Sulfuracidifex tepidarius]|uniref:Adenylosuccinate synthetase n=1 Tax=Sulfuracidifex tepidarius TaxID=1294262 RepID=A0A510DWB9_9CREN|nr:adenylosuccinate synthetase [Sulfuracidifex tepidarius]BBG24489.1 Adenylosuccinate synthetase [Sulfuracidifex tepidarius]
MLDIVVGGFYGDEGKGKVVSYLGLKDKPSLSIRTGGVNAGHTIIYHDKKWKLRILPSSFLSQSTKLALGPGAITSLDTLLNEIKETETQGRVLVDKHTGIITEQEIEQERKDEYLMKVIGSTGQGVGYAESARILRKLKLASEYEALKNYLVDVPDVTINTLENGGKVLVEGTQGFLLSLYHGNYPFVTSRNTTSSGVLSEVGVGPKYVKDVIVIFKSFVTRVGGGPLEGEMSQEEAREKGLQEFGTVTGRPRRVSSFNIKLAKESIRINSATQVAITKIDALFKEAYKVRSYDKLPPEAKKWIELTEAELKTPITLIGTGEDSEDIIDLRFEKIGE